MASIIKHAVYNRHMYRGLSYCKTKIKLSQHLHTGQFNKRLPSTLYVNNLDTHNSPTVEVNLDLDDVINNESLQSHISQRGVDVDVDKLVIFHCVNVTEK